MIRNEFSGKDAHENEYKYNYADDGSILQRGPGDKPNDFAGVSAYECQLIPLPTTTTTTTTIHITCTVGEYVHTSPVTGPKCHACSNGTFQEEVSHSHTSCGEWTKCKVDEHTVERATSNSNTVCGTTTRTHTTQVTTTIAATSTAATAVTAATTVTTTVAKPTPNTTDAKVPGSAANPTDVKTPVLNNKTAAASAAVAGEAGPGNAINTAREQLPADDAVDGGSGGGGGDDGDGGDDKGKFSTAAGVGVAACLAIVLAVAGAILVKKKQSGAGMAGRDAAGGGVAVSTVSNPLYDSRAVATGGTATDGPAYVDPGDPGGSGSGIYMAPSTFQPQIYDDSKLQLEAAAAARGASVDQLYTEPHALQPHVYADGKTLSGSLVYTTALDTGVTRALDVEYAVPMEDGTGKTAADENVYLEPAAVGNDYEYADALQSSGQAVDATYVDPDSLC